MRLYYLRNLSAAEASRLDITCAPTSQLPEFADKAAYRRWCADPKTDHAFVSGYEGLSPALRVSGSNPPALLHTLIAEYDAKVPADWVERCRKATASPTWVTLTYSGHARAYWALAKPVDASHPTLLAAFTKIAWAELKVAKLLPGFETKESSSPTQYFEIGKEWVQVGGGIPAELASGWLLRAAESVQWAKESVNVSWERLREEGERRWPGRWPGGWAGFQEGARGIRFWDSTGDAESVLVVASGCVCFTGDRAYLSWADIFGSDWVRRQTDETLGAACQGIYYEVKAARYWMLTDGAWYPYGVDALRRLLVGKGLSAHARKGESQSDVDRALLFIEQHNPIAGVFPAFHRREEVFSVAGLKLLNISRLELVRPLPGEAKEWGDGFPWIAHFLESLFREQLGIYLDWLAHFYQGCLAGKPSRGLALFLAGPTSCGKTFLNNAVHAQLFGGSEDASRFLMGEDAFNSSLFAVPVWTIDDAVASTEARTRLRFSQVVKSVVANDRLKMRGMYREGVTLPWCGRVCVTLNDDPESIQMLPSTEINLMDKIMLLRAYSADDKLDWLSDEEVAAELPGLARWLTRPRTWRGRFGVLPYHQRDLLCEAVDSSSTSGARELWDLWRREYFRANPEKIAWEGTAAELLSELAGQESIRELVLRQIPTPMRMGQYLSQIKAQGEPGLTYRRAGHHRNRIWRTGPPDDAEGQKT